MRYVLTMRRQVKEVYNQEKWLKYWEHKVKTIEHSPK